MTSVEFAQEMWTKKLSFGSVYEEKILTTPFVEVFIHQICKTLRYWWVEYQHASLKNLTQREKSVLHLQGRPYQKETMSAEKPKYQSERGNIKTRKRQVMNLERSSLLRDSHRNYSSSSLERS